MPEMRYRLKGGLKREELEAALDEIWGELQSDVAARQEAAEGGVDVATIVGVPRLEAITVQKVSAGFGPEIVIIAFLPLVARVVGDIWAKFILPRLEQRYGLDALEEKKDS
jgi:hypothetical protein